MLEKYDDIITINELCEILKIGKNNAYKILQEKKIKAFKNGKNWRITKDSIISFLCNLK